MNDADRKLIAKYKSEMPFPLSLTMTDAEMFCIIVDLIHIYEKTFVDAYADLFDHNGMNSYGRERHAAHAEQFRSLLEINDTFRF